MPYCAFISGLTKRQPSVVSWMSALRWNASCALPMTSGARVIDSTPPAIAKSVSPHLMARAASPMALRPEAHSRFTVTPGHGVGHPRQQQRHARDVAVVLAGLIGATEHDLVERRPIDVRIALHQCLDRHRREIVGAHPGERTAVAADRGPHRIADEYIAQVIHRGTPQAASPCARAVRACSSRSTDSSCSVGLGVSATLAA